MSHDISARQGADAADTLAELDKVFRAAFTAAGSTPFIVDISIPDSARERALEALRTTRLTTLFRRCPAMAVWAVLTPLARAYGANTKDVYIHISKFVDENYSDQGSRDILKHHYRIAARSIGLPVSGTMPTDLFFAPLGPAHAHHPDLAHAFVFAALRLGPPAIEDTSAARTWQRRAVEDRCPTLTRLKATIAFDQSAHCARRFEAWRRGETALGEGEEHLFKAYETAIAAYGRGRGDLLGPPRVFWTGERIGLQAESSNLPQSITLGPFPTPIRGGGRISVPPPWADTVRWSGGRYRETIQLAPAADEALIFDADAGSLLARLGADADAAEVAAERLVVLSRHDFQSPSFGPALPSADPDVRVAWINRGETLSFTGRSNIGISSPSEAALWIDGTVLGRDGPKPLYAADGALMLTIDPSIGGFERILRARIGADRKLVPVRVDADGNARIEFSSFGLDATGDPNRVTFDVLAPGNAGDPDARAELSVQAWVWPGVTASEEDIAGIPAPGNLVPGRCAALHLSDGCIGIDARSEIETPILGILEAERDAVREFSLAARGEKLWHCRIATDDRVFVPRGATVVLDHDSRHDTFRLRSSDDRADLLILGKEQRRPFFSRRIIEIGAKDLEAGPDADDRIALRRRDGRIDVLARIRRTRDAGGLTLREDGDILALDFKQRGLPGALRVHIEGADGQSREGEYALGRQPVALAPIAGIRGSADPASGTVEIRIDRTLISGPALLTFSTREAESRTYAPLIDGDGHQVTVGISGEISAPDVAALAQVASLLATPAAEALGDQARLALYPSYQRAMAKVGASRMVGSIRPVLNVSRPDGGVPMHDVVGVAPWAFQAPAVAFASLDQEGGLAPLARIAAIPHPGGRLPDPRGDRPLQNWLDRLSIDGDLPSDLDAESLARAFRTLRFRLRETDLRALTGSGSAASAAALVTSVHVDALDALRTFDAGGGGDPTPARIAATVERFARAAALGEADRFVDDIVFRTGLDRGDVGHVLTMMLRAGIDFFVHFRALWSHAEKENSA